LFTNRWVLFTNFFHLQVEMTFTSSTDRAFFLRVRAPNGESSAQFVFPFAKAATFSPVTEGCGHGHWTFELELIPANGIVSKKDESQLIRKDIYLDGVGSLYFQIDNELNIRLRDQEFLRLPSASQCCGVRN
jgi:hypothetical protein